MNSSKKIQIRNNIKNVKTLNWKNEQKGSWNFGKPDFSFLFALNDKKEPCKREVHMLQ